jgi:hypothetical protein
MKKIEKKLDKKCSEIIRKRDPICRKCKKTKSTQCAHIFNRGNKATRWDLDNMIGLCYYCHIFWAHRCPVEFAEWVKKEIGATKYNKIKKKSETIKIWQETELEKMLQEMSK